MVKKTSLLASSKAVDPQLAALFASSSGPVSTPPTSRYQEQRDSGRKSKSNDQDSDGDGDDEVLSEASEELDYEDEEGSGEDSGEDNDDDGGVSTKEDAQEAVDGDSSATETGEEVAEPRKERKRKRKDHNEDLEGNYLANLTKDDEKEPSVKRVKADEAGSGPDDSDDENAVDNDDMPAHESLTKEAKAAEADKAARTVFLANVAVEAVSSKSSKRALLAHLATAFDKDAEPTQKVESVRFRSVAFSTGSMPKRAAYITKSVMESTTHSTNAYVVLSTAAAARRVCQQLNGTEILGRHIRVDSVAHPSPTAHRRCVFVGNLGFVDDETVTNTNKDGKEETRKRNKVPSDIEEGLWRTFSKSGKVENVRVVRDPKTRVGKGFAYVQFYDANAVEDALLLDGKSFPPMLPRKLRVTRAKDPRKTAQAIERTKAKFNSQNAKGKEQSGMPSRKGAYTYVPKMTPDQKAAAGRSGKLFGRSGARSADGAGAGKGKVSNDLPDGIKAPERIVFEGRRASARDALPKDLKGKKGGKAKRGRPVNRSARRGADWKKKSAK